MVLLRKVGRKNQNVRSRGAYWSSEGQTADLLCSCQISLEKRRRESTGTNVVEPKARIVFGKQRPDIDVNREQITNGVLVFGLAQSPECLCSSGIRISRRRAIERLLEVANDLVVGLFVGTRPAGRRHHAAAQLADDLLPNLR